jgi:metal-responsive CopG/Arc/MetJ family transcriptional regulator
MLTTVSLKMDKSLLKEIDSKLKKHRYSTRTEFIRDAVRDKLTDMEKKKMIEAVKRVRGIAKHKRSTDEDLHRIREKLAKEAEKEFNL